MRIAEIDLDARVEGEPDVLGHFLSAVPGERAAQLRRQSENTAARARTTRASDHLPVRGVITLLWERHRAGHDAPRQSAAS